MPLTQQLTVTTNDTHILGTCPNSDYSYKVDGTFGGGSIEVGYMSNGAFVRYDAIVAATAATQGVVTCGQGSSVAFKLSGATTPSINIQVNPV